LKGLKIKLQQLQMLACTDDHFLHRR